METKTPTHPSDETLVLVPVISFRDANRISMERLYATWMYVNRGEFHYMLVPVREFENGRKVALIMESATGIFPVDEKKENG